MDFRSKAARVVAVAVVLLGTGLTLRAQTAGAAAGRSIVVGPNTDISFYASLMPITTSTGKKVYLTLSASATGNKSSTLTLGVILSTGTCSAGEECPPSEVHYWRFVLTPSTFGYSVAGKTAELSTAAEMDPYGSVFMSFKGASSTKAKCTSGSELTQTGAITGNIYFSTGGGSTTPWGLVKGKTGQLLSFMAPNGQIQYDNSCASHLTPPPINKCVKGAYWYSPLGSKTGVSFIGLLDGSQPWARKAEVVTASRQINLSAPAQAYRVDQSYDFTPIATVYPSLNLVAVTSGGAMSKKLVTGSAFLILRGKPVSGTSGKCKIGSVVKHEYYQEYQRSGWTDGSTNLTARSQIGGSMTVGTTNETAAVYVYTYR